MEILHWEKPLKTIKSTQCLKIPEKSLIQHCERSEQRLHFRWPKVNQKCQKWVWANFWKPLNCGQTVLLLKRQKNDGNCQDSKYDILSKSVSLCRAIISERKSSNAKILVCHIVNCNRDVQILLVEFAEWWLARIVVNISDGVITALLSCSFSSCPIS